jgi:hypothetical protein
MTDRIFRTSDPRLSFGARSQRADINVLSIAHCGFQGRTVLQILCEFRPDV